MGERGVQELYIFLLMVCTLADSARCFSGHMANDNPVQSFFVVTVDTWAGVVPCGAGGYYAFEVNTFSHGVFIIFVFFAITA